MGDTVKMVLVRMLDKGLRRYYVDGITSLPEEQAAAEVALGRAEYVAPETETQTLAALGPVPVRPSVAPGSGPAYLRANAYTRGCVRVAWVQDSSKTGGAELSNETVVAAGERCGYSIVGITPGRFNTEALRDCDFMVVNNLFEFNNDQFATVQRAMHEWRVPYVKYEHDMREIRRENIARGMYGWARLVVFLSPMHRQAHAKYDMQRAVVLPLAVEVEHFPEAPMTDARATRALVPTARKCGAALAEWVRAHPDLQYSVLGELGEALPAKNVTGVRPLPNARMRELYHAVGTVIHLPDGPWAGERVVLEAKLCGCNVVVNSNVGHASWEWFETDTREALASRLAAAPVRFWRLVEEAMR